MIRPIRPGDNSFVRDIIRTVMTEFGAHGKGFAIHDSEVEDMHAAYSTPGAAYFVCEENGKIVGGGGVAPLEDGGPGICELKKMYFLPEGRGKGFGQAMLSRCLKSAKDLEFRICYLETFHTMNAAMKLYEKNGFEKFQGPCGKTGHFGCDVFYQIKL